MKTRNLVKVAGRVTVCGCGNPDVPLEVICELLEHMPLYEDQNWSYLDDDRWKIFALHVLDGWKLIEHGGTINGSWLTADGELLLQFLHLIHCSARYWETLNTAALNGPIPEELTIRWLVEKNGEWHVLDEDDDEALTWEE